MRQAMWLFLNIFWVFTLFMPEAYASTNSSTQLRYQLQANNPILQSYEANIQIQNLPHPGVWQLGFNLNPTRPITTVTNGEIIKKIGDFLIIQFSTTTTKHQLKLTGDFTLEKYTDAPVGYFLIDVNNPAKILPVQPTTVFPHGMSRWSPQVEKERNLKKFDQSIEGNPVTTDLTVQTSLLVPLPVKLERHPGNFHLNAQTKLLIEDAQATKPAVFFQNVIEKPTGFKLKLNTLDPSSDLTNAIVFTSKKIDTLLTPEQRAEGYVIEVNSQTIIVRAATQTGFFYALQSLRQLLPPNIYAQKFQRKVFWNIPNVRVLDHPRFEYRGMHLDSARHFMPTAQVKRLIDLMAIHKLNYFQWHLTDDEAWRIEIKAYPQLTEKGAWRGFNPLPHDDKFDLFPSFGSGRQSYGGYYTQEDIREIVKYAQERHITIIPEIDLPGHARAMIMSLPQQLIDNSDHSDYTSIQGYKDNVLPACDTNTLSVIDNIMTEVAQLFPANYIHIGGDEVPHGAWEKSPACQKLGFEPLDPSYRDKVQNYFLKQVQMILAKKEKIMAGWEEIASAESTLDAPLRVYIWNSSKTAQVYKKAQEKGYEIIQAPAENLYFDLSYNANPKEPGQYWAGYVDTFSAYSFTPVDQTKGQTTELIKGVQGQLWSEQISSLEKLDYFSFPKLAGLAELAWTPVDKRNWHNFYDRMVVLHLPRLESYGVNYHDVEFSL